MINVSEDVSLFGQSWDKWSEFRDYAGGVLRHQGQIIRENRATLEAHRDGILRELGDGSVDPIRRPSDWGGFVVLAERIELWAAREGRLHDRALWVRTSDEDEAPTWRVARLQP